MSADSDAPTDTERFVSVTLERTVKRMGQWEYPSWRIVHVRDLGDPDGTGARPDDGDPSPTRVTWPRLPITLHKDAAEGYWYNLSGGSPSLFFVCYTNADDTDGDLPEVDCARVTLNHDEAAAHLETDDTVLSVAMPDSLRAWLTAFVEQHYKPQKRKKRKRTDWDEEHHEAERPRAQRPVRGN